MMLASLALVEILDDIHVAHAAIKWPNDILIGGRKVAGLLSEIEGAHLILGIGVNVNAPLPSDLPQATSLRLALGHEVELETLLQALVVRLDDHYGQLLSGKRFTAGWAARMDTLGRRVRVMSGGALVEGTADSVDPDGALRLRQRDGTFAVFHSGEVTLASQGGES
jgi:BirA family biotin operon repressor/biotin-[acetyl-CoA-carboxylase] ligase